MLTNKIPVACSVMLAISGAMICGLVSGCSPNGADALRAGQQLIEQGRPADAIPRLRVATEVLRTNATAWNYLGLAYHGAGNFTNAASAYQHALTYNPSLAEARYNLGCLYLEHRQYREAENEFSAFTVRRPDDLQGWLKLGVAQLRNRSPADAERSFAKALQLSPNHPEALNDWGLAQLERNHPREAASLFERALRQHPDYAPALLNLAIVEQTRLNRPDQALTLYRAYLQRHPQAENHSRIESAISALEAQLTPPQVAEKRATPPPSAKPPPSTATRSTQPEPRVRASSPKVVPETKPPARQPVVAERKPPEEVVKQPEPARTPEPTETQAPPTVTEHTNLSTAPAKPIESKEAPPQIAATEPEPRNRTFLQRVNPANWFERDKKSLPEEQTVTMHLPPLTNPPPGMIASRSSGPAAPPAALQFKRYSYTVTRLRRGNRAEALPDFNDGVAEQRSGDLEAAMADYRAAIQKDPSLFEAHYNLGVAAYSAGQISVALTAYETALVLKPDSRDARYNFALALRAADYPLDAEAQLKKLLDTNPNEVRVHFSLGNLYAQQLREPSLAREEYQRVLALQPNHPQAAKLRAWLASHQ